MTNLVVVEFKSFRISDAPGPKPLWWFLAAAASTPVLSPVQRSGKKGHGVSDQRSCHCSNVVNKSDGRRPRWVRTRLQRFADTISRKVAEKTHSLLWSGLCTISAWCPAHRISSATDRSSVCYLSPSNSLCAKVRRVCSGRNLAS